MGMLVVTKQREHLPINAISQQQQQAQRVQATRQRTMAGDNSNPVRYEVPHGDFCSFLKGFWKRNLEWRHFGGSFAHLRATNNVVFIEEDRDAAHQPNTQCVFHAHIATMLLARVCAVSLSLPRTESLRSSPRCIAVFDACER